MNYNHASTVLGSIMLTFGTSQLMDNGVGWLWLGMVVVGTAIITKTCFTE